MTEAFYVHSFTGIALKYPLNFNHNIVKIYNYKSLHPSHCDTKNQEILKYKLTCLPRSPLTPPPPPPPREAGGLPPTLGTTKLI